MGMTQKRLVGFLIIIAALGVGGALAWWQLTTGPNPRPGDSSLPVIALPKPQTDGQISLEKAIWKRRSVRSYSNQSMELQQIGQLMWAAQGITEQENMLRTAPSPNSTYPLSIYLIAHNVNDLVPGVFRYEPVKHELEKITEGDKRYTLLLQVKQPVVEQAAAVFIITGSDRDLQESSGDLAAQYLALETGHVAQNLLLQATALDLGSLPMGSFNREGVKKLIKLDPDQEVLYMVAVGRQRN